MLSKLRSSVSRWALKAIFGPSWNTGTAPPQWVLSAFGLSGRGGAGYISELDALRMAPVQAAVSFIADQVKQSPVALYKREGDTHTIVTDHPVALLLAEPNVAGKLGWKQLIGTGQLQFSLYNNAYLQAERDPATDAVIRLWPLPSGATQPLLDPVTLRGIVGYRTNIGGQSVDLAARDVVHVRTLSLDGWIGESPIQLAQKALQSGAQMEQFGLDFFLNESRSGGFVMHPGQLSPQAKDNIRKSIEKQGRDGEGSSRSIVETGNAGAHKIKVLEEGMKWVPTTIAPEEAQFLESREFALSEVARLFRMPLILLQSITGSTVWGTGIETLMIGFVRQTIEPLTGEWGDELSNTLLTPEERAAGLYIKFDTSGLTKGDAKSMAEVNNIGIQNKSLTINEARARVGMNPVPWGDKPSEPPAPQQVQQPKKPGEPTDE